MQEARGPLLAVPNRVDGSLAEQMKAMQDATKKDDELAVAQRKVPNLKSQISACTFRCMYYTYIYTYIYIYIYVYLSMYLFIYVCAFEKSIVADTCRMPATIIEYAHRVLYMYIYIYIYMCV